MRFLPQTCFAAVMCVVGGESGACLAASTPCDDLRIELSFIDGTSPVRETINIDGVRHWLRGCESDVVYLPDPRETPIYYGAFLVQWKSDLGWVPSIDSDCSKLYRRGWRSVLPEERESIARSYNVLNEYEDSTGHPPAGTYRFGLIVTTNDPRTTSLEELQCRALYSEEFQRVNLGERSAEDTSPEADPP